MAHGVRVNEIGEGFGSCGCINDVPRALGWVAANAECIGSTHMRIRSANEAVAGPQATDFARAQPAPSVRKAVPTNNKKAKRARHSCRGKRPSKKNR